VRFPQTVLGAPVAVIVRSDKVSYTVLFTVGSSNVPQWDITTALPA